MLHIESRTAPTIDGVARRAGLRRSADAATLADIERRRSQLRALLFVVVGALGTSVVVLSDTSSEVDFGFAGMPAARLGVLALLFGFGGYILEKERNLRQLSEMLIEQQVADRAREETMARLVAADQLKSDFVANVDRRLSNAFDEIEGSLALIEPEMSPASAWPALSAAARRDTGAARSLLQDLVSDHDRRLVELARKPTKPRI